MKKLIILGLFICIVCVAEASKPYQVSGKLKVPSDTLLVISVNTSTGVASKLPLWFSWFEWCCCNYY